LLSRAIHQTIKFKNIQEVHLSAIYLKRSDR